MFDYDIQQQEEQTQFEQEQYQLAQQQQYANPDINSNNPEIARIAAQKQIEDQLSFAQQNGVPVTRNSAQILQDAQTYADQNGVTLGEALQTTFTQPFQSKPEYKKALAAKVPMSDQEKLAAQEDFTLKQMGVANQYDIQNAILSHNLTDSSDYKKSYLSMIQAGTDPVTAETALRTASGDWQ